MKALRATLAVSLAAAFAAEIGLAAALPATAWAQGDAPSAPAADPVTLVVELDPGAHVDGERLRGAVARELGAPVVWDRGARGGTIVVRQEGARVVVSFDGPDGRHDGRAIPLPDDAEHAERDIALLAGNVARDQVSAFRAPPAVAAPPAPAAPDAAPRPMPAASPCEAEGPHLAAGIDLTPLVGVSTADRGRSIRHVSLGLAGALSGGIQGLALSGALDIAAGPLCGAQLAGAASIAGDASGGQLAGAINVARALSGAQLAGAVNVAGDVSGGQIAGAINIAHALSGVQIAGAIDVAAGGAHGLQLAPINVAAAGIAGVQIGIVNYAKDADFQLGVINVNASGRLLVDLWTEPEMGLVMAGVKHGGPHYHWIYAVGSRPADLARPWFSLGFGGHLTPSDRVFVDLDVLSIDQFVFHDNTAVWLSQARVVAGYRVVPGLAVFAGPTFNVLAQGKSARPGAPGYAQDVTDSSKYDFRAWLGATVGVEAL